MIRKIPVNALLPGMYVVDVHKSWFEHHLLRGRFLVRDVRQIEKLIDGGIVEVSIDTKLGRDIPPPPRERSLSAAAAQMAAAPRKPALPPPVSLDEERRRAGRLLLEGERLVSELTLAVRAGERLEVGRLEPLVNKMMESVARNADALIPLARLKRGETYASRHAVATTALMIALGRQQAVPITELEKMALGTLLKDFGHEVIDARVTSKGGHLSTTEYQVVQSHVEEGLAVLQGAARLPEMTVAVVLEHHERFNGSGYPYHMSGDSISVAGRLAAIVDSYDAMTSDRPYRVALSPTAALSQLYEEGGKQFDPVMVSGLVKTLGVYPVGTLVLLESGHLAVVEQTHPDDLLRPVVNVIYHSGRRQYIAPVKVDLARKFGNHYGQIVRAERFERWGISPLRWQPA